MNIYQAVRAGIFIFILMFLFTITSYIFRQSTDAKQRFAGFYAEPENTIDVVMYGASSVHPYYAAPLIWHEYGFTSYPLSSNSQPAHATVGLIKETLKTQQPKLLVVEVRQFAREAYSQINNSKSAGVIGHVTNGIRFNFNRFEMILKMRPENTSILYYWFDLGRYHTGWNNGITVSEESIRQAFLKVPDYKKGFHFISEQHPVEYLDVSKVDEETPIFDDMYPILIELLEYCKKKDLQVLFAVAPFSVNLDYQTKYNTISRIVEGYGFQFFDGNKHIDEMGIDFTADYYNEGHTNIFGAEKYTQYLGEYMKTTYNLPDHRGDEKYDGWDKSYEAWSVDAAAAKKEILQLP